eukprot:PhM_4_TR7994/c0_g1_i1/m.86211
MVHFSLSEANTVSSVNWALSVWFGDGEAGGDESDTTWAADIIGTSRLRRTPEVADPVCGCLEASKANLPTRVRAYDGTVSVSIFVALLLLLLVEFSNSDRARLALETSSMVLGALTTSRRGTVVYGARTRAERRRLAAVGEHTGVDGSRGECSSAARSDTAAASASLDLSASVATPGDVHSSVNGGGDGVIRDGNNDMSSFEGMMLSVRSGGTRMRARRSYASRMSCITSLSCPRVKKALLAALCKQPSGPPRSSLAVFDLSVSRLYTDELGRGVILTILEPAGDVIVAPEGVFTKDAGADVRSPIDVTFFIVGLPTYSDVTAAASSLSSPALPSPPTPPWFRYVGATQLNAKASVTFPVLLPCMSVPVCSPCRFQINTSQPAHVMMASRSLL